VVWIVGHLSRASPGATIAPFTPDRAIELEDEADEEELQQFNRIIAAIELAERRGIPLRVEMTPLVFHSFPEYTILPHCPFCKATFPDAIFPDRFPEDLHTCQACGTRYSPAATSTSHSMIREREKLREQIGEDAFERLTRDYLLACGEAAADIDGILRATAERERRWRSSQ
jgi:hypothetical protein